MSGDIKREALEFDECLFDSSNDIDEHLKKSKTLMSEDSGIGIGSALCPEDENPYLLNGICCKMIRSTGIHSGLSEHTKSEKMCNLPSKKYTSAFGQYLALAKTLRDSSLDSSNASSDDDCFVENNSMEERCDQKEESVMEITLENKENHRNEESIIFHRGLKCYDVESALKILKTRYLLADVNVKHHEQKIADSTNHTMCPIFIDTSVWKPPMFETAVTKTLKEIKEEIESKSKEIEGITRLILKRHQDVIDEENRLIEAKKSKKETTESKREPPPPVPAKPPSIVMTKKQKKSKNPFGRAFQSMKRFVRKERIGRA